MSSPDPRRFLQLISEGFIFVDRNFRVLEMNAEAERIEGTSADRIIGRSLWDHWPNLERSELGDLWRQSIVQQKPVSLEHFYTWPDGRSAWLEMRAFPSDPGLAIFFRDSSLGKRTEEELQRTQGELIHASRLSAMGAMAATLAHELSQPLTAISNYLEASRRGLAALDGGETKKARESLEYAGAATDRARDILKRLRDFVAKRPIKTSLHDVHSIIADAMILIGPHAQKEGAKIDFRSSPKPLWVLVDAIQVQQVLINLVRNAIEAMTDPSERRVTIRTGESGEAMITVEVRDEGPGLGEDRDRIFKPFRTSKSTGLGIGLSISRAIVEAHGGKIDGLNAPDGGALFRFTLPRADPKAGDHFS